MKNEMDLMRMNELQRHAWLCANRLTLIIVGLVWIGMIVSRVSNGQDPWFLIAMIPVFALIRFTAYHYIKRSRPKAAAEHKHAVRTSPADNRNPRENKTGGSFTLLLP